MPTEQGIQSIIDRAVRSISNARRNTPINIFKSHLDNCFLGTPVNDIEQQFLILNKLYSALVNKHKELQKNIRKNDVKLENTARAIRSLTEKFTPLIGSTDIPGNNFRIKHAADMWIDFPRIAPNYEWPTITWRDLDRIHPNRPRTIDGHRVITGTRTAHDNNIPQSTTRTRGNRTAQSTTKAGMHMRR